MSMENICDVVAMVVAHDDFKTSAESVKRLNNMALQCHVEAALSSDDRIWRSGHQVTVTTHDGMVSLRAASKSTALRDLIAETTSKVPSVEECKSAIGLLSDALRCASAPAGEPVNGLPCHRQDIQTSRHSILLRSPHLE